MNFEELYTIKFNRMQTIKLPFTLEKRTPYPCIVEKNGIELISFGASATDNVKCDMFVGDTSYDTYVDVYGFTDLFIGDILTFWIPKVH